jgi:DNA-binding CsgD family transcriptional regulator
MRLTGNRTSSHSWDKVEIRIKPPSQTRDTTLAAALGDYRTDKPHGVHRAKWGLCLQPTLRDLTPAERRVLQLIVDSKTSAQIAQELFVSVQTVEHHRANICTKLSLHGSNALLRFALAHKSKLS